MFCISDSTADSWKLVPVSLPSAIELCERTEEDGDEEEGNGEFTDADGDEGIGGIAWYDEILKHASFQLIIPNFIVGNR